MPGMYKWIATEVMIVKQKCQLWVLIEQVDSIRKGEPMRGIAMIELSIGTRFRYKGNIYKVAETEHDYYRCSECDMPISDCGMMKCGSIEREDGKYVCFRWMGYTEYTEGIEDAEIAEDAEGHGENHQITLIEA